MNSFLKKYKHWLPYISVLARESNIDKVVLFGSRARGDNHSRSDVDLAVWCDGDITAFVHGLEIEIPTLLSFDVTHIKNGLEPEFLEQIQKEGITLYEKP